MISLCNPVAILPSYKVLGNGNLTDSSINNISGTSQNIAYADDEHGNANSSIDFNGSSSRVTYTKTLDKMKTSFTLTFFIKPDVLDILTRPFNSDGRTAAGSTPWVRTMLTSGNEFYFGVGSNNTSISVTGGVVTTGWHFFAGVCSGNGTSSAIELFIDGVSVGTNSGSHTNINVNKYMSMGVLWYNTSTYLDYFNGRMSDIIIYPVLTPGEIAILNNQRGRLI